MITAGINSRKPLVSIVIPVYNGANYLRQAIESALGQTWENCEILVVNDGSDDGGDTEQAALEFKDRIRYFRKENGGVASALNYGIQRMQGEYFSWLSHDDWYYPDKIEKEIGAVLNSGNPAALVQAEYEFYDQDTGYKTQTHFLDYYKEGQITNSVFSVLQLQLHACSALIHKSHFARVGLFDENLQTIQDIDMWFRLFRGQDSIFLPNVLHVVREHRQAGSCTIPCYYEETRKEYGKLIRMLDDQEIRRVFGDTGVFLGRMAGFIKIYGGGRELAEVEERIRRLPVLEDEEYRAEEFWGRLAALSKGQARKVVIFGSGQYGIRVKYDLESRLVKPAYFVDNNRKKHGQMIDGILCSPVEVLADEQEEALVIVAMRNCREASAQLEKLGIPYYVERQKLDPLFLRSPLALSRKDLWLG